MKVVDCLTVEGARSELDLRGLRCPVPVLKFKKHVKGIVGAWSVRVLATDPDSVKDFNEYARIKNYTINVQEDDEYFIFNINGGE